MLAGILQGCPLSSFIFVLVFDPILWHLSEVLEQPARGTFRACADDIGLILRHIAHLCHLRVPFQAAKAFANLALHPYKAMVVPCSPWSALVSLVSSCRCGPEFSQGFSGIEPESREKTTGKLRETLPALSAEAAARSADARLQSRLRARCLDALAVPLAVVFALLGASSPSPLAVFAAIFALLSRSPCLRLSLRTRFPFHDSQVYFLVKSRSQILPGRSWKFQDFFFSAPEGSCFGSRFRPQR